MPMSLTPPPPTGTEFYKISFSSGVWQDFDYCVGERRGERDRYRPGERAFWEKEYLSHEDVGVEECRRIQGTTCPGGGWNASCKFGYSGPMVL